MNQSVLITGATSGIGRATTIELASHGYEVFATYRSEENLRELAAIDHVHPVRMDITVASDRDRAYEAVADAVGDDGLYALVNNAGVMYSAPFELLDEDRARGVMEANLMAPALLAQQFLPLLAEHSRKADKKSRVVNIASWSGLMSSPYISFYNASKFALIGLTESMFYDLRLLDIHAIVAIPGLTKTPFLAKATADGAASLEGAPEEVHARYDQLFAHYTAMGAGSQDSRMVTAPEQVARKLLRIIAARKPRFKYHLGTDATLIDHVVTRLPWAARVAMNSRMYQLDASSSPITPELAGATQSKDVARSETA